MILRFQQRIFSWFDSYDVYDETGSPVFEVKGKLSWGHLFHICDRYGNKLGMVEQQLFRLLPHFNLYVNDRKIGEIVKEFTFFKPQFTIDCNGWQIDGDWFEWDYQIHDRAGNVIAVISKELLHLSDTYKIEVLRDEDALLALMVVIAIDAVKCSQSRD